MEIQSAKHPRVSRSVEHWVEIALTIIWVGGGAYLLEVMHTGWVGPVVLLVVVVLIEVAFLVWNYGSLGAARKAAKKSPAER